MRKIILYIATSLNGKIAKADGSVGWLDTIPNPEKTDYGYGDFLASVDTTIQGYRTYEQLISWGIEFPYKGKTNYVITRKQNLPANEYVRFIHDRPVDFIRKLKEEEGKAIWVIGGGQINTLLFNAGLIDELRVFIMPVVIENGIGIFEEMPEETLLELKGTRRYPTGVVEVNYLLNTKT